VFHSREKKARYLTLSPKHHKIVKPNALYPIFLLFAQTPQHRTCVVLVVDRGAFHESGDSAVLVQKAGTCEATFRSGETKKRLGFFIIIPHVSSPKSESKHPYEFRPLQIK
jgi:hypothetical protein